MAARASGGFGLRVGIVGGGPFGVMAAKNLAEVGFEVTVFERRDGVGGLWQESTNITYTSVLPNTQTNTSKYTGAIADYPMPAHFPIHPSAKQISEYYDGYSEAFDIKRFIRFSTEVVAIVYEHDSKTWRVTTRSVNSSDEQVQTENFDRLVVATGSFKKALRPEIPGAEKFKGKIMHSQEFKDPKLQAGKSVLVVGLGNTSADSIDALIDAGAKRTIVSHRHKIVVIPRVNKEGRVLEFTLTFKLLALIYFVQRISKSLAAWIVAGEMAKLQDMNWPELRFHRAAARDRTLPAPHNIMPVVSDDLASHFIEGRLESAPGISAITGPKSVRFVDGTEAKDIDTILLCTGLQPDLGEMIPKEFDPYNPELAPLNFAKLPARYSENRRAARLYQGLCSPQAPHQLAFLGATIAKRPNFQMYDLLSMCLAQLWIGSYPFPSQREIERNADAYIEDLAQLVKKGDVKLTGIMGAIEYDRWMNDCAGTGLYSHLGNWFSAECWSLWWNDPDLYKLLTTGIVSPHFLRLFETKRGRKAWPGARAAIIEANERAKNWKAENWDDWKSRHSKDWASVDVKDIDV